MWCAAALLTHSRVVRSLGHARSRIVSVSVTSENRLTHVATTGKLYLVDLAGCERIAESGVCCHRRRTGAAGMEGGSLLSRCSRASHCSL